MNYTENKTFDDIKVEILKDGKSEFFGVLTEYFKIMGKVLYSGDLIDLINDCTVFLTTERRVLTLISNQFKIVIKRF